MLRKFAIFDNRDHYGHEEFDYVAKEYFEIAIRVVKDNMKFCGFRYKVHPQTEQLTLL